MSFPPQDSDVKSGKDIETLNATLSESEERYRALLDLIPVAVYSTDVSGRIQQFNQRATELWGRTPTLGDTDQLFSGSFKYLPGGTSLPYARCPMATVVSGEIAEASNAELVIERPDGSRITVSENIVPLKNGNGEITGAMNCFHDISDRRQLERKAEQVDKLTEVNQAVLIAGLRQQERRQASEKQNELLQREIAERKLAQDELQAAVEQARRATSVRENLLAVVSHDLRNPLSVILMATASMARPFGGDDRRKSHKQIGSIKRAAERMNYLIQDLLDAASIEAGELSVERRRLAVAPLIGEAIDAMQLLAARKSLRLENELPADLAPVCADTGRVQQVFANLLANAIKFTPDGGTITVRAETVGEFVQFSVTDTGTGIPGEDLPHLFDRFWQAPRTARQGTGLGLSIVRGIVVAQGGQIWVESRVGAGSTFFFTLPLALDDAKELAEGESAPEANDASVLQKEVEKHAIELEELAEPAGQFRREFVGLVSHELRGPLTGIELLIERIRRDRETPPTPHQETIIWRVSAAVARLTTVIESLLQHALIETGPLATQIESFDVRLIAAGVCDELRPSAEEKGIELRRTTAAALPSLRSDPVLVRLILLNLVGNAIKFTARGAVDISVDGTADGCRIAVKDSGVGIPADERVRIFEPFAKAGDPEVKYTPGLGLGLALVQEVASALGGQVALDSEVGRGSTFTVSLPSMSEVPQGASGSKEKRVLQDAWRA